MTTTTGAQTRTFTTEIEGKTLEIGLGRLGVHIVMVFKLLNNKVLYQK